MSIHFTIAFVLALLLQPSVFGNDWREPFEKQFSYEDRSEMSRLIERAKGPQGMADLEKEALVKPELFLFEACSFGFRDDNSTSKGLAEIAIRLRQQRPKEFTRFWNIAGTDSEIRDLYYRTLPLVDLMKALRTAVGQVTEDYSDADISATRKVSDLTWILSRFDGEALLSKDPAWETFVVEQYLKHRHDSRLSASLGSMLEGIEFSDKSWQELEKAWTIADHSIYVDKVFEIRRERAKPFLESIVSQGGGNAERAKTILDKFKSDDTKKVPSDKTKWNSPELFPFLNWEDEPVTQIRLCRSLCGSARQLPKALNDSYLDNQNELADLSRTPSIMFSNTVLTIQAQEIGKENCPGGSVPSPSPDHRDYVDKSIVNYASHGGGHSASSSTIYSISLAQEYLAHRKAKVDPKVVEGLKQSALSSARLAQVKDDNGSHLITFALAFASQRNSDDDAKKEFSKALSKRFDPKNPLVVGYDSRRSFHHESECSSSARAVSTHLALYSDPEYQKAHADSEKNLEAAVFNYQKYLTNLAGSTVYGPTMNHDPLNCLIANYYFPSTAEDTFKAIDILLGNKHLRADVRNKLENARRQIQFAIAWTIQKYLEPSDAPNAIVKNDKNYKQDIFVLPLLTKALGSSLSAEQADLCRRVAPEQERANHGN